MESLMISSLRNHCWVQG